MDERPGPYLPPDGVGVISEKVRELKGLFDFFKEHLDIPPGPVKLNHRPCAPLQIIGEERHDLIPSVHLDQSSHAPQRLRVSGSRLLIQEYDLLIGKHTRVN